MKKSLHSFKLPRCNSPPLPSFSTCGSLLICKWSVPLSPPTCSSNTQPWLFSALIAATLHNGKWSCRSNSALHVWTGNWFWAWQLMCQYGHGCYLGLFTTLGTQQKYNRCLRLRYIIMKWKAILQMDGDGPWGMWCMKPWPSESVFVVTSPINSTLWLWWCCTLLASK